MMRGGTTAPRVTFLIATHEVGVQFERALASCLEQTFADFEVVLVANGMDDETFGALSGIASRDLRVRLVRTSLQRLTFSLNLGLHLARGEYVARMDSDDRCYPTRLREQVDFLDSHPDVSICGSWCDLVDIEDRVVGEWTYPLDNGSIRRMLYHSNPLCHPAVMFRRTVLLKLGGYSGFFAEDYLTWALLSIDSNVRFANLPRKLIAYRAAHKGHRRNLTWRNAKAQLAGAQLQLYGMTHDLRWLRGVAVNLCKTFLRNQ